MESIKQKLTLIAQMLDQINVVGVNSCVNMAKAGEIDISEADALMEEILENSKDSIINAVAIGVCIDLKLLHHHNLIVQCFANGTVDIGHVGDLEDVEIEMRLKTKRERPKQLTQLQKMLPEK